MTDDFFDFIVDTTKGNFKKAQDFIFNHKDYNPYSSDLSELRDLLEDEKFEEVINFQTLNTLLSPRSHLYKNVALEKLGKLQEAKAELLIFQKILEGISLTGNGTKEEPYFVTSISDERDFLMYIDEEFESQSLVQEENKIFDLISLQTEKQLYFDITIPYLKMNSLISNNEKKYAF